MVVVGVGVAVGVAVVVVVGVAVGVVVGVAVGVVVGVAVGVAVVVAGEMKLTLTLIAASLVIRFTTPGPGAFWLLSTCDGYWWDVEMCAPVDMETHVSFTVPPNETCRWFAVMWEEE